MISCSFFKITIFTTIILATFSCEKSGQRPGGGGENAPAVPSDLTAGSNNPRNVLSLLKQAKSFSYKDEVNLGLEVKSLDKEGVMLILKSEEMESHKAFNTNAVRVLEDCLGRLAEIAPQDAYAYALELEPNLQSKFMKVVFYQWALSDAQSALSTLKSSKDSTIVNLGFDAMSDILVDTAPLDAYHFAKNYHLDVKRSKFLVALAKSDPTDALALYEQDLQMSSQAKSAILLSWTRKDVDEASDYLSNIESRAERADTILGVIALMTEEQSDLGFALIDRFGNDLSNSDFNAAYRSLAKDNPRKVLNQLKNITDGQRRAIAIKSALSSIQGGFSADEYFSLLKEHELEINDDTIGYVLDHLVKDDLEVSIEHLNQIKYVNRKSEYISKVLHRAMKDDPMLALELLERYRNNLTITGVQNVLRAVAKTDGVEDKVKALDFCLKHNIPNNQRYKGYVSPHRDIPQELIQSLLAIDRNRAIEYLESNEKSSHFKNLQSGLAIYYSSHDPKKFVELLESGAKLDKSNELSLINESLTNLYASDPEAAEEFYMSLSDRGLSTSTLNEITLNFIRLVVKNNGADALELSYDIQEDIHRRVALGQVIRNVATVSKADAAQIFIDEGHSSIGGYSLKRIAGEYRKEDHDGAVAFYETINDPILKDKFLSGMVLDLISVPSEPYKALDVAIKADAWGEEMVSYCAFNLAKLLAEDIDKSLNYITEIEKQNHANMLGKHTAREYCKNHPEAATKYYNSLSDEKKKSILAGAISDIHESSNPAFATKAALNMAPGWEKRGQLHRCYKNWAKKDASSARAWLYAQSSLTIEEREMVEGVRDHYTQKIKKVKNVKKKKNKRR